MKPTDHVFFVLGLGLEQFVWRPELDLGENGKFGIDPDDGGFEIEIE